MATIDSKEIIKTLLENNGVYPGDPQVSTIWSYVNMFGNQTHAVFMTPINDMETSPHVKNPVLLWRKGQGITAAGAEYLKSLRGEEEKVKITKICMVCRKQSEIVVPKNRYNLWRHGNVRVQDAFPDLTQAQREILITGTHDDCWKALFQEE